MKKRIPKWKQKWRAKRWIDTSFSQPYKLRVAMAKMQCAGIIVQGSVQCNTVRFSNIPPPSKAAAIAGVMSGTASSIARVMKLAYATRNECTKINSLTP